MLYMNNTHRIPAALITDNYGDGQLNIEVNFQIPSCPGIGRNWLMGVCCEGNLHRETFGGPIVTNLYGFIFRTATVIALHHIEDTKPTIVLEFGDLIEVEGHGTFCLTQNPARWQAEFPKLVVVA